MIKQHVEKYIIDTEILMNENLINIHIKNEDCEYNLAVVYAPQKKQHNFFKEMLNKIKDKKNLIIIGDFNFTSVNSMQTTPRYRDTTSKGKKIINFFDDLNLKEIHNKYKENNIKYTYTKGNILTRLDRVYTNPATQRKIISYKIKPNFFSDHQAVIINIRWKKREKWGKGTWKINNEILLDKEYQEEIKNAIEIYRTNKTIEKDVLTHWDNLKNEFKKFTIEFSTKRKNKEKEREKDLQIRLGICLLNYEKNIFNEENEKKYKDILKELKDIDERKNEGARIRARKEKYYNNERPTNFFLIWRKPNRQ